MDEDVVINIIQKGADVAESELLALAKAADKAVISTDALTGKTKTTITNFDQLTGATKRVVIEDGKLTSATETVNTALLKQKSAAAEAAAALAQEKTALATAAASAKQAATAKNEAARATAAFGASVGRLFTAIGLASAVTAFAKQVSEATVALQAADQQLRGFTASSAEFTAVQAQFATAVGTTSANAGKLNEAFGLLKASSSFVNVEGAKIAATLANASNAIRAGGGSAQEAAAGVKTFAEAMKDGRISGEEYANIQERFPELARVIAKETGMSAETIKVLGVSANDAAGALDRASQSLKDKAEANLTLTDRVNMVVDSVARSIVEFDKQTGASKILVKVIEALGEALTVLWNAIKPLIVAIIDIADGMGKAARAATDWLGITNKLTPALNSETNAIKAKTAASLADANASNTAAAASQKAAAAKTALNAIDRSGQEGKSARTAQQDFDAQTQAMPKTFVAARASGGPVTKGKQYLVGEEGPELWVAPNSGTIIPNGGSAMSAVNDNRAAPTRSLRVLTDAVREAVEEPFTILSDLTRESVKLLTALVDYNKETAKATATVATAVDTAAAIAATATASGTSGINNFGIPGLGATGAAIAPPSGGGGGGSIMMPTTPTAAPSPAQGDITSLTNGQINAFVKGYYDLIIKNWDTKGMYLTDSQRERNFLNAERYIANVPSAIQETVKQLANARLPQKLGGAEINFRSGGAFGVSGVGTGGPDSRVVPMRVTPGEQVHVRTRAQVQADEQAARNDNAGSPTYVFQINTPDADSFRRSEKQVLREFARKASSAMRS